MGPFEGNISSLTLTENNFLPIKGNPSPTLQNDPVLGSLKMLLVAQALPRVYPNPLHLMGRAIFEDQEPSPRSDLFREPSFTLLQMAFLQSLVAGSRLGKSLPSIVFPSFHFFSEY